MSNKIFKNQKWLDELTIPCPSIDYKEKERVAYRWVFPPIEHASNFKPQFFKNKQRFNTKPPDVKCKSMGLSLYDTEENAKKRFDELKELMSVKAYQRLGKNIAKGTLAAADGVSGIINDKGHFTFFSYEKVDLVSKFAIISNL